MSPNRRRQALFKVVIFGSRTFGDYQFLKDRLNLLLAKKLPDVEIVHGCATGADAAARLYAMELGLPHKLFTADWKGKGKAAGPLRNAEMAEYAEAGVAFWDGKSRGTANMIEQLKKRGKPVKVVHVEG